MSSNSVEVREQGLGHYYNILIDNLFPFILISVVAIVVAIVYAISSINIYKSTTVLKISKPSGNILNSPLMPEFQDFGSDRFIANEIEVLKSYKVREIAANALIDSFKAINRIDSFKVLVQSASKLTSDKAKLLDNDQIASILSSNVTIEQKRGLDIVEISSQSPSPFEASLIANLYAQAYKTLNLEFNRNQLTLVKAFLLDQKNEKLSQLNSSEELLKTFQEKGGIIALDDQAKELITQLSKFEADRNLAKMELAISDKTLKQYKEELRKQDPQLTAYLENFSSEEYLKNLQTELARLEVNRDIALISSKDKTVDSQTIKDYDAKIKELRNKLKSKIEGFKTSILASSPEEVKLITKNVIEEEIKSQSLEIKVKNLDEIVKSYDTKFNQLPKSAIEYARLQRGRESLEKLYILVEEKYQEAVINEQSQPGNVIIIDRARRPASPAKPNRLLIILVGTILGFGFGLGYAFLRNYFDNTVKTPEDLKDKNINVIGWVPQIQSLDKSISKDIEFIIYNKPDSVPSEAFRALRTRVQFSKVDQGNMKVIHITSSTPGEGKTLIASNLAGSFAQANHKTLLLDCDLRKPRVHTVFGMTRQPGLVEYLFDQVDLKTIIKHSKLANLDVITVGTIPPNPAEMLGSKKMQDFIDLMKTMYDYIIIDSPPIISVTDSEIIAAYCDAVYLVVSANYTEFDLLDKALDIIKNGNVNFVGTILNNFVFKNSYGSYYKYYYYYYNREKEGTRSKTTT
ncbi:MAG: polysaccharide biosynthesis tyrosine autokinase [Ignavibacteriaceae bacterium]|nr:polysaccharide biosynthesis tyrosine autokinase [Ignavibacteriaceae bacterium]